MDVADVLVTVDIGDTSAAIVRDPDGDLWLSDSAQRICGTRVSDYRPCHQGLSDDRTLLGGRLAPGAVAAEVIDDAGQRHEARTANGAWIAAVDQPIQGPLCPVCCRDAHGQPIAPPLPAGWARAPVLDAAEPCPACGGVEWDQVTPTDDSRGQRGTPDGRMEPTPIVVCRTCGHEESIGAITHFTRSEDEDSDELARRIEVARLRMREQQREQLASVDFPIYAADGWAATMAGSGGSNGRTTRVRVAHSGPADQPGRALQIETAENKRYRPSEYALARAELERWLHTDSSNLPTNRSDAGLTIAWRASDRERRQRAAIATRDQAPIRVDGKPELFTILKSGQRWVAVRQRSAETLTLSANDVDPTTINLTPLVNPIDGLLED
jgi:hypothetical protein